MCLLMKSSQQNHFQKNLLMKKSFYIPKERRKATTDERYNSWLLQQGCIPTRKPATVMTKVLSSLPPVMKNPAMLPKTTARVLTSEECRKDVNEKAKKKAEALRLKQERKAQRA